MVRWPMRKLAFALSLLLSACGGSGDDDAASDGGAGEGGMTMAPACSPACDNGQFCEPLICGGAGECTDTPEICTREYDPVCGCDNRTYGNECGRQMARMGKAYHGECLQTGCNKTPPSGCCFDNGDCGAQTCYGAMMCAPGAEGVCKSPPASGMCWSSADCPPNRRCMGAQICPCGAACLVADSPGTCTEVGGS